MSHKSPHMTHLHYVDGWVPGCEQGGTWCRGVVNRDLKPENLLLKKKNSCQEVSCTMDNLRCVDFGSAAKLEPGARHYCSTAVSGRVWLALAFVHRGHVHCREQP